MEQTASNPRASVEREIWYVGASNMPSVGFNEFEEATAFIRRNEWLVSPKVEVEFLRPAPSPEVSSNPLQLPDANLLERSLSWLRKLSDEQEVCEVPGAVPRDFRDLIRDLEAAVAAPAPAPQPDAEPVGYVSDTIDFTDTCGIGYICLYPIKRQGFTKPVYDHPAPLEQPDAEPVGYVNYYSSSQGNPRLHFHKTKEVAIEHAKMPDGTFPAYAREVAVPLYRHPSPVSGAVAAPDAFWLSQMTNAEGLGVKVRTATGDCIGIGLKDIDGFCAALKQVAGEVANG